MRLLLNVFALLLIPHTVAHAEESQDTYGDRLGSVHFPVTGSEIAAQHVQRGVALLHHMMYASADKVFSNAIAADPDCAMGYWGKAMTLVHPLWPDTPSREMLIKGLNLVETAERRGRKTKRESAYIETLRAYFHKGTERTETERLSTYEQAWKRVYKAFPEDLEAAAFYSLAHMATASTEDKTYRKQREAGRIVEGVLAKVTDHPGAHHYIIHAYDFPPLAERALPVARNYGKIAPAVPHALHMPTHIFTRRGLWQESIDWNIRSAEAAWKMSQASGGISVHYLHALDYLAYAYLQSGEDEKALRVVESTNEIQWKQLETNLAGAAYAFASIPARYALERQNWEAASQIKPRQPSAFPWGERFSQFEAISHFARALGAARTGQEEVANEALETLKELQKKTLGYNAYWAKQVEIRRLSALAWFLFEKGRRTEALRRMNEAAGMEASTYKHPVMPGEVLSARELLADLLLELGNPDKALNEYEKSLKRASNRFNSLYGAGRAAESSGQQAKARYYFQKLVDVTPNASPISERLRTAKDYLIKE